MHLELSGVRVFICGIPPLWHPGPDVAHTKPNPRAQSEPDVAHTKPNPRAQSEPDGADLCPNSGPDTCCRALCVVAAYGAACVAWLPACGGCCCKIAALFRSLDSLL